MSPGTPAICQSCGHIFESSAFSFGPGPITNVTMSNNSTQCPSCGGRAKVMDGTFNVRDGGFELLAAPQWSWDLVESLRLGLREILDHPPDDPVAALAQVSPAMAQDVAKATGGLSRGAILAVLSGLATVLSADYTTVENNLHAVARFLEYVLTHGTAPPVL